MLVNQNFITITTPNLWKNHYIFDINIITKMYYLARKKNGMSKPYGFFAFSLKYKGLLIVIVNFLTVKSN